MKYYRVKKDTFIWKEGAILEYTEKNTGGVGGYRAIEDIWNATPTVDSEYISAKIIEHEDNAVFFERVYPDTVGGKLYKTKDQLIDMYRNAFVSAT